jgi:hypothetical protein
VTLAGFIAGIVAGLIGGALAWAGAQFFARDYEKFRAARALTLETLFYFANVGYIDHELPERILAVEHALRTCAAQLYAVQHNAYFPVLLWLRWRGFNLDEAVKGITGYSHSIARLDEGRAMHKRQIEAALKLPT